jgi:hypothetical protein
MYTQAHSGEMKRMKNFLKNTLNIREKQRNGAISKQVEGIPACFSSEL